MKANLRNSSCKPVGRIKGSKNKKTLACPVEHRFPLPTVMNKAGMWFKVPNEIVDGWIKEGWMDGSDISIVLFICRKTFGWQKPKDIIAVSQIVKGTGLSEPTVKAHIKKLLKNKVIFRRPVDKYGLSYEYCLNCEDALRGSESNGVGGLESDPVVASRGLNSNGVRGSESDPTKESIKDIYNNKDKNIRDEPCSIPGSKTILTTNQKELPKEDSKDIFIPMVKVQEEQAIEPASNPKNDELVDLFSNGLKALDPKFQLRQNVLTAWHREIEQMLKDGRTHEEIRKVIEYVQNSYYWNKVITGMNKIKKHFTTLWAQANATKNKKSEKYIVGHSEYGDRHKLSKERLKQYLVGTITGKYKGTDPWETDYKAQLIESGLTEKDLTKEDYENENK